MFYQIKINDYEDFDGSNHEAMKGIVFPLGLSSFLKTDRPVNFVFTSDDGDVINPKAENFDAESFFSFADGQTAVYITKMDQDGNKIEISNSDLATIKSQIVAQAAEMGGGAE